MNFALFTNFQLAAALVRYEIDFHKAADEGYLLMATSAHDAAELVRAELAHRANVAELSREA